MLRETTMSRPCTSTRTRGNNFRSTSRRNILEDLRSSQAQETLRKIRKTQLRTMALLRSKSAHKFQKNLQMAPCRQLSDWNLIELWISQWYTSRAATHRISSTPMTRAKIGQIKWNKSKKSRVLMKVRTHRKYSSRLMLMGSRLLKTQLLPMISKPVTNLKKPKPTLNRTKATWISKRSKDKKWK